MIRIKCQCPMATQNADSDNCARKYFVQNCGVYSWVPPKLFIPLFHMVLSTTKHAQHRRPKDRFKTFTIYTVTCN